MSEIDCSIFTIKNGNPSYKESIKHFIPIYRNNNAGVNNQLTVITLNNNKKTWNRVILYWKDSILALSVHGLIKLYSFLNLTSLTNQKYKELLK